jgi:hypothetical protein
VGPAVKESQAGPENMDVHATCPALDSLVRVARTGRIGGDAGMQHSDEDSIEKKMQQVFILGGKFWISPSKGRLVIFQKKEGCDPCSMCCLPVLYIYQSIG